MPVNSSASATGKASRLARSARPAPWRLVPPIAVVFPIFQGTVFTSEPGESYHDIKYHRLNSTPSQTYLHDKLAARIREAQIEQPVVP